MTALDKEISEKVIQTKIDLEEELERLDEARSEAKFHYRSIIRKLQEQCSHSDGVKYHGDPSGNNDSWRECVTCGKEL